MAWQDIRILDGPSVERLITPAACIAAVEAAFRERGEGRGGRTGVLGVRVEEGGFHVKAAAAPDSSYFVAKINANFPGNPDRHGLPTIQGTVTLFDGHTGAPLAILDSVRVTALRTAAASAVAARYLSNASASTLAIVGCGAQASGHVGAMRVVRPIRRLQLFDTRTDRAERLATAAQEDGLEAEVFPTLRDATRSADIVVTCTPARAPILDIEDVTAGVFVAAVGADHEHKIEITPALMARARVVADLIEQCAVMGDLRGAIAAGVMTRGSVHAELGDVVAGRRPGRTRDDEIFVFDSTGVAFQDLATAIAVYQGGTNALDHS